MNDGSFFMTQKTIQIIHRVYGIALSLSLTAAGVCLMAGCLSIYNGGDPLYSREMVIETFSSIAFPVCLFPVLALLGLFLPGNRVLKDGKRSVAAGLINGKDLSTCDVLTLSNIRTEQAQRKKKLLILLALTVLCGAVFLGFALWTAQQDGVTINDYVIRCMLVMLPCLAVPFGYGIYASSSNRKSLDRQWELVKRLPSVKACEDTQNRNEKNRFALLLGLTLVALLLIVVGRLMDGAADVLTKAINICTECIGLG